MATLIKSISLLLALALGAQAAFVLRVGRFDFSPGPEPEPVDPPAATLLPLVQLSAWPESTLSVWPGTWTGEPAFSYQWLLDGQEIEGATNAVYVRGASRTGTWSCRVSARNAGGTVSLESSAALSPEFSRRFAFAGSTNRDSSADGVLATNIGGVFGAWGVRFPFGTNYLALARSGMLAHLTNDWRLGVEFAFLGVGNLTNRAASGGRDSAAAAGSMQFVWNGQSPVTTHTPGMAALAVRNTSTDALMQWRTEAGAFDPAATNDFRWCVQWANLAKPVRLWINDTEVSLVASNSSALADTNLWANTAPIGIGAYLSGGAASLPWNSNSVLGGFEIRRPEAIFSVGPATSLFLAGSGGVANYRIPALIGDANGTLVAFAEARNDGPSDDGDIDLVASVSTDDFASFSPPVTIHGDGDRNYDPSPFIGSDGVLRLVWLNHSHLDTPTEMINGTGSGQALKVFQAASPDMGRSWGAPVNKTTQWGAQNMRYQLIGPNGAAYITTGPLAGTGLIVGTTQSTNSAPTRFDSVFKTQDNGTNWTVNHLSAAATTNNNGGEMLVWRFGESGLLAVQRGINARKTAAASFNGGETWTTKTNLTLPIGPPIQNGLAIVGTNIYLTFISSGGTSTTPAARYNLVLAHGTISAQGDIAWNGWQVIDRRPAGYSCLWPLSDGRLALLYEGADTEYWDGMRALILDPTNAPTPGS